MRCGAGASSRNGGFLNYSLTHGIENGRVRFPDEIGAIERLGMRNYEELCADLGRYAIDAELESTGELDVAVAAHQVPDLEEGARVLQEFGQRAELLDRDAIQAEIHSPLYLGGLWQQTGAAIVNPAKLADGLRDACLNAGVQIFEHSCVRKLQERGDGVDAITDAGVVHAAKVLLATSAYDPLLPALRRYVAPVYDYALMTEPLTTAQLDSIGWKRRQGIGDSGYQFHYYRLSADNRILWGGYDAVYRYGGPVGPQLDDDEATFARLSHNFFTNFPQLAGVGFTHRWGGAIDTCSRFSVFFGTRARWPRRLRARLHRPWRRRKPLRRAYRHRPAGRPGHRCDCTRVRASAAGPVPAGAAAQRRDPVHAQPSCRGGSQRPSRNLATYP